MQPNTSIQSINPNCHIVIGSQWGDEGKGKWVDYFAGQSDIIARFQGGGNAGHTLYDEKGDKLVLHQIPSAALLRNKTLVLGAGMVVNPLSLLDELGSLEKYEFKKHNTLMISRRAHVITPWHIYLDQVQDSSSMAIGTTKKGIGPTYAAKFNRKGIRFASYIDADKRNLWVKRMIDTTDDFEAFYRENTEQWVEWEKAATQLAPYVRDCEKFLFSEQQATKKILLEGAQGCLLDIDYGTYPYVTSSNCGVAGALSGSGISHKQISKVTGIAKAYITRVGEGPFPTAISELEIEKKIAEKGGEYGATTGRRRICGWFDAVAMRTVQAINGMDDVIINKIDILSGVETLKIATAYIHPTLGKLQYLPAEAEILAECTPEYETYAGWSESDFESWVTSGNLSKETMPKELGQYLEAIASTSGINIGFVGYGPGRNDFIKYV